MTGACAIKIKCAIQEYKKTGCWPNMASSRGCKQTLLLAYSIIQVSVLRDQDTNSSGLKKRLTSLMPFSILSEP